MFFSTKVMPYVYIVTHKITGQFYVGFRCANKVPSSQDLGSLYFTSSKFVKKNFSDFDIAIYAEFFDKDSAYECEQLLIKENFDNPLILNKHWQSTKKYSMLGFKRNDLAEYNKKYKIKPKEMRKYICASCNIIFDRFEFIHHKRKELFLCSRSCNGRYRGKLSKGKNNSKLSETLKGRVAWNKGLENKTAAENGKKGAAKLSNTVMGRKRKYNDDGTWTWVYPQKGAD